MNTMDAIIHELETEAKTTARVLERVPEERLSWRPHEKSMSLGQLALHIADTPELVVKMITNDTFSFDPATFEQIHEPKTRAEILETHERAQAAAKQYLSGLTAEQAAKNVQVSAGASPVLEQPRATIIRVIMLNHTYHHRGQLSVYLRMLGVPVPSIYGPSADENPFIKTTSA